MASDFDFTTTNEDQYANIGVNVDDIREIVVLKMLPPQLCGVLEVLMGF